MKAIVFPKVGKFEIKDVKIPEINNNEVLIKNKYAGLCGTDLHIYKGEYIATYPIIPGHEFSGIVEKVGKNVKRFKKGDKVAVDPTLVCNNCYYCKNNEQNLCINRGSYGTTSNGGFAEYTKIIETNLYKINNINLREAAIIEPLSCAIYGLSKMKVNYGEKALIFGTGSIGLILLQLLKISGVSRVTMVDICKDKIKLGEKLGADEVILNDGKMIDKLKSISKIGFNILIDATGIAKVCEDIFKFAARNARILLYGVCKKESKISISPYYIFRNSLSVYGAFSLNHTTLKAIELLENNRINLKDLISHEFKLNEFENAFRLAKSGNFSKIVFNCTAK